MRVINPKNGTQIRLSKRYEGAGEHGKISYLVDRAAVAAFNNQKRHRFVNGRMIYKHPSN